MYHLERAVVAALFDAKSQGDFVGPAFVTEKAGIYRGDEHHDYIAHAMLHKLLAEGRVERGKQPDGRGGWALTDAEFDRLQQ